MTIKKLEELDISGKTLFIRADLNVPVKDGKVTNDVRIQAVIPTLKYCLEKKAKVLITSHLGRPTEGEHNPEFSLQAIVDYFKENLPYKTSLNTTYLEKKVDFADNDFIVLENVRFNKGEKKCEDSLSQSYANLCDIFVMDAFGTAHRAEASTYGIAKFAKIACAGPLLCAELDALAKALKNPQRPVLAIVGGSKVSTKLTVLEKLGTIADSIIVGGGITNTFLLASGHDVGNSLKEEDLVPVAKKLLEQTHISLPTSVKVAKEFNENAKAIVKNVDALDKDDMIFDISDEFGYELAEKIKQAKTIIWNGPVGVFEFPEFRNGTKIIAEAISNSSAFSLAGGGDTIAAIDLFNLADKISYISTGGGAFLEFVEGKTLPAVEILEKRGIE